MGMPLQGPTLSGIATFVAAVLLVVFCGAAFAFGAGGLVWYMLR